MRRRALMEGSDEEVKEWKMLRNFVLDEDARTVTISQDDSGAPFSISDFILQINGTCDATGAQQVHIMAGGITFPNMLNIQRDGTDISSGNYWMEAYNVGKIVLGASASGGYGSISNGAKQSTKLLLPIEPLTSIGAQMASALVNFKAGTQFILYGR